MHDGTILSFNVAAWKFEKLKSVQLNKVKDLDYSLIGELCVLSCVDYHASVLKTSTDISHQMMAKLSISMIAFPP